MKQLHKRLVTLSGHLYRVYEEAQKLSNEYELLLNSKHKRLSTVSMQLYKVYEEARKVSSDFEVFIHSKHLQFEGAELRNTAGGDYMTDEIYGFETKARMHTKEIDILILIIKAAKKAITLGEIISIANTDYHGFIPSQIIDAKTFIQRRLNKACAEGKLICEMAGENIKTYRHSY